MIVCICNAISDREIRGCVDLGAETLDELRCALGVATCCGRCAASAQHIVAEHISKSTVSESA